METITIFDDQVQIALRSSIYAKEAAALRETLLRHLDQGRSTLILDLSKREYLDNMGLGCWWGPSRKRSVVQ